MEKFTTFRGVVAPLDRTNVDTDAIIPKQFLKSINRAGFGVNLFDAWRFIDPGEPGKHPDDRKINPDFVLNKKKYQDATILLSRDNFGCGSSREHAVWAIYDYGFRAVVSSFFADIFKNNCLNIGVLPVQVSESFLSEIFSEIDKNSKNIFEINLKNQEFNIISSGKKEEFKISTYKKSNMSNGFDDIDYLINKKDQISTFANKLRY